MKTEIKDQLTYDIIGCAMKVHSVLGNGFQEVIYQRAMAIEMGILDLNYIREFEMEILYKETEIGKRRVDFLSKTESCLNQRPSLN